MQFNPTYIINKTISATDPFSMPSRPGGGLYRFAAGIRDMPFDHPFASLSLAGAAAGLMGGAIGFPFVGTTYALATAYSTMREAFHAAPKFARMLERIGAGRPEFTAPMVDTRAAMSMRQASLRALHDSGYFLRNVIGKEARLMHR